MNERFQDLTLAEMAALASSYSARALSWTQIANLFDRHVYCVRSGLEQQEFDTLWSAGEDVCWMVNDFGWSGREAVRSAYAAAKDAVRQQTLTHLSALAPAVIANTPEELGAGEYELHSLVTPYIQVAGDNNTARGVWYSPGIAGHVDEAGTYRVAAVLVCYAADFVREEGGWKLRHLREYDDASVDVTGLIHDSALEAALRGETPTDGERPGMGGAKTREELEKMLAEGKAPPGRTGDTLRTLWDLPPAAVPGSLTMKDRPQTTLLRPNRFIDDMVEPYETWTEDMSVLRDY